MPTSATQSNLSYRSAWRFLIVGGSTTALHYLLILALHLGLGFSVVQASVVGFIVSAIVNYFVNSKFTFQAGQSHRQSAPRFFLTASAGLGINYLVLSLLLWMGLHPIPAQMITTLTVLVWNYSINAIWTFKK